MADIATTCEATRNIRLDAKAAWGIAHDSAISGAERLSLDTNRMLTEAKLTGNWGWNAWQLSQSGAVTYIDETGGGITGLAETSVDVTRFTIEPELKRHIDTGNGASIEPCSNRASILLMPRRECHSPRTPSAEASRPPNPTSAISAL
jgi:hypothetical protein